MLISDHLLLNYKRCNRRTFLETYGNFHQKDPEKDFLLKLKRENQIHIGNVIQSRSLLPQQPSASRRDWQLNAAQTVDLMQQGADCIIRGTLSLNFFQWQQASVNQLFSHQIKDLQPNWLSEIIFVAAPSLLIKQPGQSCFGDWEYIPVNIKFGRKAKPEYKLIAAFHAQILSIIQAQDPVQSPLILKEYSSSRSSAIAVNPQRT